MLSCTDGMVLNWAIKLGETVQDLSRSRREKEVDQGMA